MESFDDVNFEQNYNEINNEKNFNFLADKSGLNDESQTSSETEKVNDDFLQTKTIDEPKYTTKKKKEMIPKIQMVISIQYFQNLI